MKRKPFPEYSPDIASSELILFSYIKNKLKGQQFASKDDLKEKVLEIFNSISQAQRTSVFLSWIKRTDFVP